MRQRQCCISFLSNSRPYLIDLESSNKTFLNGEEIEPARYYELRSRDVIKFGFSEREFVVLCDEEAKHSDKKKKKKSKKKRRKESRTSSASDS